jgi:hypothetical protein
MLFYILKRNLKKTNFIIQKSILIFYEFSLKIFLRMFFLSIILHLILNFNIEQTYFSNNLMYPSFLHLLFFNIETILLGIGIFLHKKRINYLISIYNLNNLIISLFKHFIWFILFLNFWNCFWICLNMYLYKYNFIFLDLFLNFKIFLLYFYIYIVFYVCLLIQITLINTLVSNTFFQILINIYIQYFIYKYIFIDIFNLLYTNLSDLNLYNFISFFLILSLFITLFIEISKDFVITYSLK